MRISTRITLALTAASLGVFGLYGVRLLHRESRELRAALEESSMLLAQGLGASLENSLRDGQSGDVRAVLETLSEQDEETEALVVRAPDGGPIAATAPLEELPAARELLAEARRTGQARIGYLPEDEPGRIVVAMPMANDSGVVLGTLLLTHPLDAVHEDLRRTTSEVVLSVLLFVLSAALLGTLLGRTYIGRPLEKLALAMRAVRLGDLRSGVSVGRNDEMTAVGEEFNSMVGELRETREHLRRESDARRRMEAGLQEASKMATIGQLGASLAHEIGSPLQVLGGRARLLIDRADEPERVRHNARIIAEQSDRIAGILDQLLRLVRDPAAPAREVDVGAAVGAVVELLQHEADRRGSSIELAVAADAPRVEADPGQLQQIALNLIHNSLHATPAGRRVLVEIDRAELVRPYEQPVDACRLRVVDEGAGMSPEELRRALEPFYTTRAGSGGTGLGLTVVKSLVERYRGAIAIDSARGRGTRVEVLLPAVSAPQLPPPADPVRGASA